MENNGPFGGADRTREKASEMPLIVNDHNVIDNSPDTNNCQLFQFEEENNSTNTLRVDEFDVTEYLFGLFGSKLGPNLLAVIEDDSPNDSRETNFSGNGSTGNIINPETKDVEEKVTGGDANELETQIDSQSDKENEIGTNTDLVHNNDQLSLSLNLEHYTHNENPQNLQSSVNRCHLDLDVPTSNWSPGDPRPSTSSTNSMQHHNLFKSVTTINSNSRSAQDETFPCDLCNKSFANQRNLKRHMLTHTRIKSYTCDLCDKSFTRKPDRTRHMFTHTGIKPYTCDLCNKSFADQRNLKRHMLTHTRIKSYTCDLCDKSYSCKYERYRHMLKCTGKKLKWTCPECDKNFSSFEEMMTHRHIHTIEKPFKCRLCEYATHRKDGLSSHMKTHSTDRVSSSSSTSEARPTHPGSSPASPATRPASNHSNEQQLPDQIPAEPVRQEQPEAAQAPVELAGNETILLRDQIAPQVDQDVTA
ncbi:hypothetical protein TKK_0000738 [Trichogramma kaykai]